MLANGTITHYFYQTARIWDAQAGESKMELRGHEHVVEVVTFAPVSAYSAIRELAGIPVGFIHHKSVDFAATYSFAEY
jgi:platelet-activating factor acetylhydrolase IB subunit alpha